MKTTRHFQLSDHTVDVIKDQVEKIYKWKVKEGSRFYTVIREFNMPKYNVFPKEMLANPQKAICMFVKKDELGA